MQLPLSLINPDNKLLISALVFCFVCIVFLFEYTVYRLIRNDKREREEKNKILPVAPHFSPFVFVIYHIETFSVAKCFVSEDECCEYFKKHYSRNPAYNWVALNIQFYDLPNYDIRSRDP